MCHMWLGTLSVGAVLDRRTDSADKAYSRPVGQWTCQFDQVVAVFSERTAWPQLQVKIQRFEKFSKNHWKVR